MLNFTNNSLSTKQRCISFGVDFAYTLGVFGIGEGVGALASAGVTWFIEWTNEKWGG